MIPGQSSLKEGAHSSCGMLKDALREEEAWGDRGQGGLPYVGFNKLKNRLTNIIHFPRGIYIS